MNRNLPAFDFAPETAPLRRTLWLIFLVAGFVLFFLLGRNALLSSEGETAEAMRQILGNADIFNTQWQPEHPMVRWFAKIYALPAAIFGNNEFACRFPAAFSALLFLAGMMILVEDFFDWRVMCCTAWMLISSYGFIYWGRFAGSFMMLAAWGIWSAVLLRNARAHFWWRAIFFLVVLTGSAFWGMNYILQLPGIIFITFSSCRRAVFNWRSIPAVIFAGVITGSLLVAAVNYPGISAGEYWPRILAALKESFADSWHTAVYPGISANIFKNWINWGRLMLPWTLPVTVALAGIVCKFRELSDDHRHFFLGTVLLFCCTGLFPGRRWEYQLCQLPFFLASGAAGMTGLLGVDLWNRRSNIVMKYMMSLLCSFMTAVIITWPLWEMVFLSAPPLWIMFGVPVLGLLGLLMIVFDTGTASAVERLSGISGVCGGYILAGTAFMIACFTIATPALTRYRTGRPFWEKCGEICRPLPSQEVIFFAAAPSPVARYYMNLPGTPTVVHLPGEVESALDRIDTGDAKVIIRKMDIRLFQRIIAGRGWKIEERKPLAVEAKDVDFSDDNPEKNNSFVICRIYRGAL